MAAIHNGRRPDARIAVHRQSIWSDTPESAFRRNVVMLAKARNGVGCCVDPMTRTAEEITDQSAVRYTSTTSSPERRLTIAQESRLAEDLAFISADQEGVHGIAAASIEEVKSTCCNDPPSLKLVLRIAANGGVSEVVREALYAILRVLQSDALPGMLSVRHMYEVTACKETERLAGQV
jgi:hypothetical protein